MILNYFVTDILWRRARKVMAGRQPDVVIAAGPSGQEYLRRWHLIPRNKFFNLYLHEFVRSDTREMHSHPWGSMSIMLSGCLKEWWVEDVDDALDVERIRFRLVCVDEVVFRNSRMFHRIEVPWMPAVTLVFTGPRINDWFFATPLGAVQWEEHLHPERHNSETL
jgi:hypothetical protein